MNDPILFWNAVSLEVHRRDFTLHGAGDSFAEGSLSAEQPGPTRTSRSLAMVHIAMYEAFAVADPTSNLQPYAHLNSAAIPPPPTGIALPPPVNADTKLLLAGAVAGAASTVLSSQWGRQKPFIQYALDAVSSVAFGNYYNHGLAIGIAIGNEMINIRQSLTACGYFRDNSNLPDTGFPLNPAHGMHRPDPFSPGQGRLSTKWGMVTPFCIAPPAAGAHIHTGYLADPPSITSNRYKAALRDVKGKGDRIGTTRVPDETMAGIFWGYDGSRGLGVPPRLYNQVVRAFVDQNGGNTPAENARLFALINAGMADAAIVAWSAKYAHDLWRPVVGIREHDAGFGANNGTHTIDLDSPGTAITADCDPTWAPLGRPGTNTSGDFTKTPDFPAYPSGHATFGAVVFQLTGKFYEQKTEKTLKDVMNDKFTFISDEFNGHNRDPNGDERVFHRRRFSLCEAIIENALSRVYLGVHWRFDGLGVIKPDDLTCKIPDDPSKPDKLNNNIEKELGGVPAGLKVAEQVFSGCFTVTPPVVV